MSLAVSFRTLSSTNGRSIQAHVIPAVPEVSEKLECRWYLQSRSSDSIAGRQRCDGHQNRESDFPSTDQETLVERLAERSGTVGAGEYALSGTPSSNS